MSDLGRVRGSLLAAGTALTLTVGGALASGAVAAPTRTPPPTSPGPDTGNPDRNSDRAMPGGVDHSSAIVRLSREPLATDVKAARKNGRVDFTDQRTSNERALLAQQRNDFRQWLRTAAPDVHVTGQLDVALNAVTVRLNGTDLSTLSGGPGVVSVSYQAAYSPMAHEDPDLSLVDAEQGWSTASPDAPDHAGEGVKVGIVDTGIDLTHPCFSDKGYPQHRQVGDSRFTNNKVIAARVFANKAARYGLTPEAVQDHGTHVAGTVACDAHTPATVDGTSVPYDPSGVAPRALLGSYNVFPGVIEDARSEDILNALQAAYEDGMDVINMSLGGGASGVQDLLTMAVDNLDRAGVVVAVSAGNEGPGHYTVGSPGSAERALTAGASTVGHFVGLPVTDADNHELAVTAEGDFGVPAKPLTRTLVAAGGTLNADLGIGDGCAIASVPASADGALVLVARGACTFGTKVANAERAGAKGVIVVNNVPGDPIAMATDPAFPTSIPAVMAGFATAGALEHQLGNRVTIGSDGTYRHSGNDDIMGDFSSQGPTDVDYRVKPDLVAPGVNVLSSVPSTACTEAPCWAFYQGTSMASPHLAGAAAVVRQAHPDWTPEQVRSAITNTATEGTLTQSRAIHTPETDPLVTGAGLLDVDDAVGASLALSQVSTSFGVTPSGAGRAISKTLTVTNLTDRDIDVRVRVRGDGFSSSVESLSLAAGGSAELTLTYAPGRRATPGDHVGRLMLGDRAHSVLYAFVK